MAKLHSYSASARCGQRKAGGFKTKIYLCCGPCDLPGGMPETLKEMGGAGSTTPEAEFTFGEAFSHVGAASGHGAWKELDAIVDESEVKNMIEGSKQGVGIATMLSFIVPGFDAKASAFIQSLVNYSGCLVFMLKARNGTYPVIGTTDSPAWLEASEGSSGKLVSDIVGTTFNVKADTGSAVCFYPLDTLGINLVPVP